MYSAGDKLVCVNDDPYEIVYRDGRMNYMFPIRKGTVVTVRQFIPAGTVIKLQSDALIQTPHIACGYINVLGIDAWPLERFRRPVGLDIQQALQELKDMPSKLHREMANV